MSDHIVGSNNFSFLLLDLREEFEQLFLYTVLGKRLVFRPLYLSELESIAALIDKVPEFELDEWIVTRTFLGGETGLSFLLDDAPAGFVASIAASLMAKSKPGDIKAVSDRLTQERSRLETDGGLFESTMLMGVGNILGKSYRKITAREQSRYLALAEKVLKAELTVTKVKEVTGKTSKKRAIDPATAAMLSAQVADKPDFESDNKNLRAL